MPGRQFVPPSPSAQETLASRGVTLVPSTAEERATLLDQTEWSRRFSWQQLQCFAIYLHRYQLEPGRMLFREGEHDAFAAIVLAGQLAIRKNDLAEQTRVVATVGRGKLVGEMSILDGTARSASAVAVQPTDLLVMTKKEFQRLGDEHPKMALDLTLAMAIAIAQLLRQTTGALVEHLGMPDS
jgi:CRP-like cAMP-binding protein